MIDLASPSVLSGWKASSARIEGGSISGISARPRTQRCAGFLSQPPDSSPNDDRLHVQACGDAGSII